MPWFAGRIKIINSPGWPRLPHGRAFLAAPARYASRSRAGAAYASRLVKASGRDRMSGLRRHILPAMHPGDRRSVPPRSGPETGRGATRHDVSRPEAAHGGWAGIDAGGPRPQVPGICWLSEKAAVNRGNGASPGPLNRPVPPPARIPAGPGDTPSGE